MRTRHVVSIMFYTADGKLMLQDRRNIRKYGEVWGFFGGGLEPDETKEEGLVREIKEELDYDLSGFSYLGQTQGVLTYADTWKDSGNILVIVDWFVKQIPEDVSSFTILEGAGAKFFSIEEVRKLKIVQIDIDALILMEKFLNSQ